MKHRLPQPKHGIRRYLKEQGLTKLSDPNTLAKAKRAYQRQYSREYKRKRRKDYPTVSVSLDKGQWKLLTKQAAHHHLTLASFLREAALAYTQETYLVPHAAQVAQVEQRLVQLQTDLHIIVKYLKSYALPELAHNYSALEERLIHLESYVSERLRAPKKLEVVIKEKLQADQGLANYLKYLLQTHDHQN